MSDHDYDWMHPPIGSGGGSRDGISSRGVEYFCDNILIRGRVEFFRRIATFPELETEPGRRVVSLLHSIGRSCGDVPPDRGGPPSRRTIPLECASGYWAFPSSNGFGPAEVFFPVHRPEPWRLHYKGFGLVRALGLEPGPAAWGGALRALRALSMISTITMRDGYRCIGAALGFWTNDRPAGLWLQVGAVWMPFRAQPRAPHSKAHRFRESIPLR